MSVQQDELHRLSTAVAPAKMILLGEHAVVYGEPALAVPVWGVTAEADVYQSDGGFTMRSIASDSDGAIVFDRHIRLSDEEPVEPLAVAARAALSRLEMALLPDWHVEVRSTIPIARGMGSSAAVAVAAIRAISRAGGIDPDDESVSSMALEAERKAHGSPSGIDNAVVAHARPIRFESGSVAPIIVGAPLTFIVADSGPSAPTHETVAHVRRLLEERPVVCHSWFRQIGQLTDDATSAIEAGEVTRLGRAMSSNHLLLQALQVSTPQLDRLVASARGAGALGAKLSGAGRGGVVAALVDSLTAPTVMEALRSGGALETTVAEIEPSPTTGAIG
jgi:mevalonate kinase